MNQDSRTGHELTETDPEDGLAQGSVTLDLTQDAIRQVSILSEPDQHAHARRPDIAPDVVTPTVITKESWSDDPAHRDPDADD